MTTEEYELRRRAIRKGDFAVVNGKLVKIKGIAIDSDGRHNYYEAHFVYVDDENGYTFHTDIALLDLICQKTATVLYGKTKKR